MKKTYISPAALTVQLSIKSVMLSESLPFVKPEGELDETNSVTESGQILTKEHKSLWDNEW
ncbi:MAG: hypothetical protein IJ537_03435 [Bacteroidaceae bacterium]|nr:hypothetical protein [Bacteroidaceae bacterium]MBQ8454383.1 hypothetical protein [Bacteroidaceae bacterium]MBQ9293721.1 hypothetical protein [Bacteroidaceae bacterium]